MADDKFDDVGGVFGRLMPEEMGEPKRCVVCDQQTVMPNGSTHHLECSPIQRNLCLGCWMFQIQFEVWLLRARGRSIWTGQAHDILRILLRNLTHEKEATDGQQS